MRSILFTSIIILFLNNILGAQENGSLSGTVVDQEEQAVYFANAILYNHYDTSLVKVEYTDESGKFNFSNLSEGNYFVTINYVGLSDIIGDPIELTAGQTLDIGTLQFGSAENELDAVTITAKKPLLELKADKVVMNVQGSINASGEDAFSLLRKSPGVVVDNNDNIQMLGKSGVIIYIDDKPSYLTGEQLVSYLKTISSAEIASIEIISNPSAKYDAQGSAGIINIKLVKNKSLGTKGQIESGYGVGIKSRHHTNLRLDTRKKDWSAFGSVGLYRGEGIEEVNFYREQFGNTIQQVSDMSGYWQGINLRTGIDYFINDKSTIGMLFNLNPSEGDWNSDTRAELSQSSGSSIDSILLAGSYDDWNEDNWNANLNYKFSGENDRSLNIDLDHGSFSRMQLNEQPNSYYDPSETVLFSTRNFEIETPRTITISTAKLDYEMPLLNGTLGLGTKFSHVVTDNSFNFYNDSNGVITIDPNRSNDFRYTEDVAAGYFSYNTQINKLNVQLGLRAEHTHSNGQLTTMNGIDDQEVDRNYLDFFPNIGFGFQANEKNAFNFRYSRRLNRPAYELLNPFKNRLDELTFEQGNPFLNPEYAQNFQISHAWNYKLNTSISYSIVDDLMTRIVDTENENAAFITWLNLDRQTSISINISAPLSITEWWNTYTSITGTQTTNEANYGETKAIDIQATTFNIYNQQSFNLPNDISMELSGWYNSPSIWGGNFEIDAMYSLDFGIQKSFIDKRLRVKLSVSDIFRSQKWSGVSEFGALYLEANGINDTRRLKVNISYRFGNSELKNSNRKSGLEDEMNRIQ